MVAVGTYLRTNGTLTAALSVVNFAPSAKSAQRQGNDGRSEANQMSGQSSWSPWWALGYQDLGGSFSGIQNNHSDTALENIDVFEGVFPQWLRIPLRDLGNREVGRQ